MKHADYYTDADFDIPTYAKERLDIATDVAVRALEELQRNGIVEALLLKNEDIRQWWAIQIDEEIRYAQKQAKIEEITKLNKQIEKLREEITQL